MYASDAPETAKLRCAIIAPIDNSPLVIAAEKGFFKKYGVDVAIAKGANWAAIRDSLSSGDNQLTHMLKWWPWPAMLKGCNGLPGETLERIRKSCLR